MIKFIIQCYVQMLIVVIGLALCLWHVYVGVEDKWHWTLIPNALLIPPYIYLVKKYRVL